MSIGDRTISGIRILAPQAEGGTWITKVVFASASEGSTTVLSGMHDSLDDVLLFVRTTLGGTPSAKA